MADKRKHSLMPFDTGAWLTDPRVNTLSLMAKGAWVGLLCYMWESSQRGMLVKPNNAPYTLNELVALSGCTDDEPIQELIDCGVLSLNHKGVYYSADMVKQADISEKRRNAGKKGGDAMKHRISEAPKKGIRLQRQALLSHRLLLNKNSLCYSLTSQVAMMHRHHSQKSKSKWWRKRKSTTMPNVSHLPVMNTPSSVPNTERMRQSG